MSSIERDVAEALFSVYEATVGVDFESMTKEELIVHIKNEAEGAKNSYCDFALAYGWVDSREEFEEELAEKAEELVNFSYDTMYERVEEPEVLINIRQWLADRNGWEPYLIGKVTTVTKKAFLFMTEDLDQVWIPRSQLISIEE